MNFLIGGILSLLGFAGLAAGCAMVNNSGVGSRKEKLGSILVLLSALAALVMVCQGFHLWNEGWSIDIDSDIAAKATTKARGKGGIIILIIKFFPQFLVFGYSGLLFRVREVLAYSLGLVGKLV